MIPRSSQGSLGKESHLSSKTRGKNRTEPSQTQSHKIFKISLVYKEVRDLNTWQNSFLCGQTGLNPPPKLALKLLCFGRYHMTQQSMALCGNKPYMTRGILSYFLEVKEICS